VAATSAVDVRVSRASSASQPELQLTGVLARADPNSIARSTEVDVIVIDADTDPRFIGLSRDSTPHCSAHGGQRCAVDLCLLRSGVCAILSRESGLDDVLSGIMPPMMDGVTEYTRRGEFGRCLRRSSLDLDAESSDEIISAKPRC